LSRRPVPAPLSRRFYARPVLVVARALLGRVLRHDGPGGRTSGRIVEVEAYRGADDPASHAFRGETVRNRVMFGPPGHAYVYFTYGMHYCVNLVTGPAGRADAVLIRALEPLEGLALMRRRRGVSELERLARGPGCVTRALGLDRRHDGLDLTHGPLVVESGRPERGGARVARGPRIGIRVAVERPWRFWLAGHTCVSGPRGVLSGRTLGVRRGRRRNTRGPNRLPPGLKTSGRR
jgi:DNA-3-methyladenine glycosylase